MSVNLASFWRVFFAIPEQEAVSVSLGGIEAFQVNHLKYALSIFST
jgi:hypothetical protein